jgi:hypothetical protein
LVTTPPASAVGLDGKRKALRRASRRAAPDAALIVIEAGSILVRIGRGAETKAVEAILRVLKKTPRSSRRDRCGTSRR